MFRNITPITKMLILINGIVFLITEYALPNLKPLLAGYYPQSVNFKYFQIITHMFMHGGWSHLFFNMFTLWSFGPVLERLLGRNKFIIFYFLCGIGAYALYNLWNYFEVQHYVQALIASEINPAPIFNKATLLASQSYYDGLTEDGRNLFLKLAVPMVGASGAIFGVIAGFSLLFPNAKLVLLFIPYPIKAKFLLPVVILVSLYLGIKQYEWDPIAHFAHIGGALIGILWILNWKKKNFYKSPTS